MSLQSRISILGAGFAALTAARELRRRLPDATITLVASSDEFVYSPSLIWVPSGLRHGEDLRFNLQGWLTRHRIQFHHGRVTGLSEDGRKAQTTAGEVENDALVIASGGRFLKALPGIEHAITICEGIAAAEALRDRLAAMHGGTIALGFGTNPKEPAAMRGGPMFELLFGLDTLLRQQGRRDRFRLVFFNPAPEPGKRLGEKAVKGLLGEMKRRHIETHLGHKILGFEADRIKTEGGEIPADMILFMPGMTGPDWLASTDLPKSGGGFVVADAHCQVSGLDKVFVAGDAGSYPGPDWMPKQAHMADLQARTAAENLVLSLEGKQATARFKPELICIVDMLDKGILVYRDEKRALILPPMRLMHWAKRLFEWLYLRQIRNP
ncbi:MAG: FAD-dependent oxidoreductase [Hydrogenophilaceae bacterium]|nr:FAD-dependent oxidoreductase [Hydrogenophilaceae bacterium]